jgi:hydrogenase/urease accessory protein HupE
MHRPGLNLFWSALAVTLAVAPSAQAHLMNTGLGPFYDGLTHLFLTPEDLLPVIALALFAGLRGPQYARAVLFVLPVAWLVGMLAGRLVHAPLTLPAATAIVTIAFGVLVAADRPLPMPPVVGCAAVLGLLHGGLNGIELGPQSSVGFSVVGVAVALFVVVSLLAGQVISVQAAWGRIVVRVAGSWIAASGLFMLGWAVRAR